MDFRVAIAGLTIGYLFLSGRELDAIIARRGKPAACASDNGTRAMSR